MNGELTEREREFLDMWPKFEDGEPVMIGDEATNNKNQRFTVKRIEFRHGKWMLNDSVTEGHYLNGKSGKRVKRPAPKALDADGMEIKVGDTVWDDDGVEMTVMSLVGELPGHVTTHSKIPPARYSISAKRITHTRPDSWERLEEDACKGVCEYAGARLINGTIDIHGCDGCRFDADGDDPDCEQQMARDIIRRAKKLAGVER